MDSNGGVIKLNCNERSSSCSSVSLSSASISGSSMISPKSPPPGSADLYGRRRQMARVQLLEREIALLQDELKSVKGVQAASRCCKEIDDFVGANADPLIHPLPAQEAACVSHQWWTRLRRKLCCDTPRICCGYSGDPCSSLLCHGHRCLPDRNRESCHCCPRTAPSCSCKCKDVGSRCECGTCPHSCCL